MGNDALWPAGGSERFGHHDGRCVNKAHAQIKLDSLDSSPRTAE
jgi:hypothetical protein